MKNCCVLIISLLVFICCFQIPITLSGQGHIEVNLVAFKNYFQLSENSSSIDDYVSKYSKQVVGLPFNKLDTLVPSNQGNYQKAKALLMLTVLNLNKNISSTSVSANYYYLYYYDLKRRIWITLILK